MNEVNTAKNESVKGCVERKFGSLTVHCWLVRGRQAGKRCAAEIGEYKMPRNKQPGATTTRWKNRNAELPAGLEKEFRAPTETVPSGAEPPKWCRWKTDRTLVVNQIMPTREL